MKTSIVIKHFSELTPTQLYDLLELRQEVFVVEQKCIYMDCDGLNDREGSHILIYDDNILAAYARLLPTGLSYKNEASIGRIITKITHRGTGLGKVLMDNAMEYIYDHFNTKEIRISAQCYAIAFYQKCGFEPIGEEYMEDDIPHTNMITSEVQDKNYYIEH